MSHKILGISGSFQKGNPISCLVSIDPSEKSLYRYLYEENQERIAQLAIFFASETNYGAKNWKKSDKLLEEYPNGTGLGVLYVMDEFFRIAIPEKYISSIKISSIEEIPAQSLRGMQNILPPRLNSMFYGT